MRLRSTTAAVALVLALGVAACGGGDGGDGDDVATLGGESASAGDDGASGGGSDGDSGENVDFEDALLDFTECMRDEGIDMPDPHIDDQGGGGVMIGGPRVASEASEEEFQAADEKCRHFLEEAEQNMEPPSAEEQAEMRDHALAFAECMRGKGFDMPDPEFGDNGEVTIEVGHPIGGGGEGGEAGELERPSAEFEEAATECNEEIGGPMMGGGPGGDDAHGDDQ
ncbi:hypothetical protein BH18ACT4_BH18ACT4_11860 [soil metagenome]